MQTCVPLGQNRVCLSQFGVSLLRVGGGPRRLRRCRDTLAFRRPAPSRASSRCRAVCLYLALKRLEGLQMAGRIVGARLPFGLQDYLQHPDFALQAGDHFKISGV